MMISGLLPVLLLMLFAWIWLDGARAREFATALAQRHCERHQLQMLDETVALARIGLRWTSRGLRIRRMFRFEFSLEGAGRQIGYVLLLGLQAETIDDGLDELRDQTRSDGGDTRHASTDDGKVVPFRQRDR